MQALADTLTFLRSVDSTNNYAIAKLHAGLAKHGDGFLAGYQTAGKGQRGKQWQAKPGENLLFSLVVEPQLLITQQFLLSMAVALACRKLVDNYVQENIFIKWPNDIFWNDRKAGGILIENILASDTWKHAVIGVGLNLNQVAFEPTGNQPVSLRQLTGKLFTVTTIAKELAAILEEHLKMLYEDPAGIVSSYNNYLYKRNETVVLRKNSINTSFVIKAVDQWGELIAFSSVENRFRIGEVEWIR